MTKEELKKEAEEYALKQWEGNIPWSVIQKSYYDSALPREKRIAELEQRLEQTEKDLTDYQFNYPKIKDLEKENDELKEGLAVGSMWNKHLNSLNKELEEDRDKYRNMVFDKDEQLTKAKELLSQLVNIEYAVNIPKDKIISLRVKAEQFLSEVER